MALTTTPQNYYQYGNCDALADLEGTWSGSSAGTESDFYKEGAGCLGFTLRTSAAPPGGANNDITYTKTTGTWDLSGVKHLRLWFLCSTPNAINTEAYGIQFWVGDATNSAYYYLGGRAVYPGGWYNFVIDLSRTVDSGTKPTNMLCTKIGLRLNLTSSPKNIDNVWIDNLIRCDGLKCTSDTQFGLQDIFDKDDATTGAWGVVRKIGGVYYLTGGLVIGDNSGTLSSNYKDTVQVVMFEDRGVNSSLYDISVVGNSTGVTKFQVGDTPGILGCTVKSQSISAPQFTLTCTDGGLADANYQVKLYGSTFTNGGTITLPATSTNREVLSCNFESCGEVLANTCKVQNCNLVLANDRGLRLSTLSHNVSECSFITCGHGVHVNLSNTDPGIEFNGLQFSGSDGLVTWDVEHSAAGALKIVATGSNVNASYVEETGGGSTTVQNTVTLKVTVVDELGASIYSARVGIYKDSDNSELMNELTVNDGGGNAVATQPFNYPGMDVPCTVRVRKGSSGATQYVPVRAPQTIRNDGLNVTITLSEDPINVL